MDLEQYLDVLHMIKETLILQKYKLNIKTVVSETGKPNKKFEKLKIKLIQVMV